jgi:hypothetical protein
LLHLVDGAGAGDIKVVKDVEPAEDADVLGEVNVHAAVAIAAGHGDTQTEWRVSSGGQAHQRRDAVRQEEAGAKVVERLSIILATGVVYIHNGCSGP